MADLSPKDLERILGLKQGAAQTRALRGMGLRPYVRPDGTPVVTWEALTMAMTGHLGSKAPANQPDFSALG